jgi:hypothetical protein
MICSGMAYIDWQIKGKKLGACNCAYGCPCDFNSLPTYGNCEGLDAMELDDSWWGELRLGGLRYVARYHWPGPIHEGRGDLQVIIDERANSEQQAALLAILGGKEQEPTTVFNIYRSTVAKTFDPIIASIEFVWDMENRRGYVRVRNIAELNIEPIQNPITGKEHRISVHMPSGFEFHESEVASATAFSKGDIAFTLRGRHGHFWYAAYGPYGIIDS